MRLLVAGMTGQLGAGLAAVTDLGSITCLVRDRRPGRVPFHRQFPGQATVSGDVTRPDWGLATETVRQTAGSVDAVLNLAGETDWAGSSKDRYQVNVLGARYGAELAERLSDVAGRPIPYCYASTVYVAGGRIGTVAETGLPADGRRTGYEQSKWLAEQELLSRGGRVLIARVAALLGDSASGATSRRNSLYLLADRWPRIPLRTLPAMPGARIDALPRDIAAQALLDALSGMGNVVEPTVAHVALGERAPTLRSLLETARALDPHRFTRWVRTVPAPAGLVLDLSMNLERFLDLSPTWRNSVIGLRYIGIDRQYERGNLALLTGGRLPYVSTEALARLLFGLPEPVVAAPAADPGLSRFTA